MLDLRTDLNQLGFRRPVLNAFTHGDCWALAVYLHDRTGWDIVALGLRGEESFEPAERYWEHMAVRTPAGQILDVTGVQAEGDFMRAWVGQDHHACLFVANDPGYRDEMYRQFRHSVHTYGEQILTAIGQA